MNEPFIIVGGGLSGILMARLLHAGGVNFLGFEREDRLGGRLTVGHHRIYDRESADVLSGMGGPFDWFEVTEKAKSLNKKKEWVDAESLEADDENFYLSAPFLQPNLNFSQILNTVGQDVMANFRLKTMVIKVDPVEKIVELQSGEIISYSRLFWCCDLRLLLKLIVGDKTPILKLLKNAVQSRKGINVDLELKALVLDVKNTIVFPFRFKEKKLRALGSNDFSNGVGQRLHWLLFLDDDFADDHEEVAKCLRTFRKALEKEFPEIGENLLTEKIFFLPSTSGDSPTKCKSAEIFPEVFYLGSQLDFSHGDRESRDLDVVLHNFKALRETAITDAKR